MSNVFEVLKRMGGVVVENDVTYVTHPNPPDNDDSQKIATTAWVKDITDRLEASVSGGMFPKIQHAVINSGASCAPSGGTWWCYCVMSGATINRAYAGGERVIGYSTNTIVMCIKIA